MRKRPSVKGPIIVDTGFFAALLNKRDRHHQQARTLAGTYEEHPWITTWPVLTELSYLLPCRAMINLIDAQQAEDFFSIYPLEEGDLSRMATLFERYRKEKIDFADISLVILAEQLECGNILTCDRRDFNILRWDRNRPFRNLWDS